MQQSDSFSQNLSSGVVFFLFAADRKVQRDGQVGLLK